MNTFLKLALIGGLSTLGGQFVLSATAHAKCSDNAGPEVDWSGCRKRSIILSSSDLTKAKMNNIDMIGTDLRQATLTEANLSRAQMARVNASGANMVSVDLSKAEGGRVRFLKADLTDANLEKSVFFRGEFTGSKMVGANLNKSEFSRSDFSGVDLTGADLSFANFSRAQFKGAKLDETSWETSWTYLTRFEGVDLTNVTNLTQSQIDISCGDANTKLPAGLTAPASWPCSEDD